MTAHPRAGAASPMEVDWHAIDWQHVNHTVRRLQARIVKATQEGRWNKVRALQRLLTHSFSGKALAVRRVTENQGKRTPGVDGETWPTPAKKAQAVGALRSRGYQPRPLRRIYIPKQSGGRRPLGIPTMLDRAMQALYLLALDPIAETTGDPNSYGFRKGRSTADAIAQCYTVLGNRHTAQWVLEGDITSCFDRISHEWLLAHIPMDKAMLRKWLKAGCMEHAILKPTDEGTPQGGIISPVLANLALDGLERLLRDHFPKTYWAAGRTRTNKVNLVRYADDFIITGDSREQLEDEIRPLLEHFLEERGLHLSATKTVVTHIEDGFDFLGQNVRKYNGKILIKPSKKNVRAFLAKVRGVVKGNPTLPAGKLIAQLNPLIRGWAQYHQHVVSRATFGSVDSAIFEAVWRWAKRRHPKKGAKWVKRRYFPAVGSRNWTFSGKAVDGHGKTTDRHLFRAESVPIKRHAKVQSAANPYDPAWQAYFAQRLGVKVAANLSGYRTLLRLWNQQNGLCPNCGQPITTITGWHSHHVIWRSKGGSDDIENRLLLHPNCHMQIHSPSISVVAPRPMTRASRKA
jgi:RNA-directed DNA polymerase